MKNKLLKEIKEGFDFATQDAIDKGLIKVKLNDNGEKIVELVATQDQIKEAYLNDADLTEEQKKQIK